jgi:hypothetical protein
MSGAMAAVATFPEISPTREVLDESAWLARKAAHVARVRQWTEPYRRRAARGEKHPVYDFLWEYYSQRPSLLERWHPGIGVVVAGDAANTFLAWPEYARTSQGITATVEAESIRRLDSVRWIRDLLRGCATRPAYFRCFGLHEWAMVYRASDVRHPAMPLRFSRQELAAIVEALPVRCSHFDAFRFFTAEARPLNRLQPAKDTRLDLEQRGCVHVTMDLYKWAYKLTPFVPSELVADCFALALAARELDMRASPYDLSELGFTPMPVETPDGRREYESAQRALSERATPLRTRLLAVCDRILTPPD